MKSIINTIFCLTITILLSIAIFLIVSKINQVVNDKGTKLPTNNSIVTMLEEKISISDELRLGNVTYDTLSNEQLIKYALSTLEQDDYIDKTYESKDGLCTVETVMFNNTETCKIRIINTDTLINKISLLFNKKPNLEYIEIEYNGLYCKYDNNKYYCLINSYTDYNYSYILINEAYEKKEDIIIYDYYLNIDVSNENDCNKYFNEEYCTNYKDEEKPSLEDKTIKENGTQYQNTFTKEDNVYYLKESKVIN